VISLTVPIILLVILSLLFPSDFKFKSLEGYEGLIDIPESELEGENV
jgi:hypothetical protein